MSDVDAPVVALQHVGVRYRVPRERIPTFKEFAIRWLRGHVRYETLDALHDVTLTIRRGEAVGIVGRNGAGKSTLLKVMARVLRPTTGTVHVDHDLAPLLELGAGFDPELSGRENVFLNGALLGRTRAEMRRRFDAIVDFAELEDFIDAPLRTYSTGMVARLGFAVATDIEPAILLVDEVLSVGDIGFQEKCTARIRQFLRRGATLILVSHSPDTVRGMCDRAVLLEHGRIVADGTPDRILETFEAHVVPPPAPEPAPPRVGASGG